MAETILAIKACAACGIGKPITAFHKKKGGAHGVRASCKDCRKELEKRSPVPSGYSAKYYADNKEKQRLRDRRVQRQEYYLRTRGARIAYGLGYAKRNPEIYAKRAMFRLSLKAKAVPLWADEDDIQAFYDTAQKLNLETGIKWHVDHIVPLNSQIVCGLHVSANLQVITASENISKSNDYWPDMP